MSKPVGGVPLRAAELVVALVFVVLGGVVISDSLRLGAGWSSDGPQSGYFPFYVGSIMAVCGLAIAVQTLRRWKSLGMRWFSTSDQLLQVVRMFVPIVVFVVAMLWIGLYAAAAIYIAAFMRWQGKFSIGLGIAVGVGVSLVLFALFELWFHVPLPKGPIEQWLGF